MSPGCLLDVLRCAFLQGEEAVRTSEEVEFYMTNNPNKFQDKNTPAKHHHITLVGNSKNIHVEKNAIRR